MDHRFAPLSASCESDAARNARNNLHPQAREQQYQYGDMRPMLRHPVCEPLEDPRKAKSLCLTMLGHSVFLLDPHWRTPLVEFMRNKLSDAEIQAIEDELNVLSPEEEEIKRLTGKVPNVSQQRRVETRSTKLPIVMRRFREEYSAELRKADHRIVEIIHTGAAYNPARISSDRDIINKSGGRVFHVNFTEGGGQHSMYAVIAAHNLEEYFVNPSDRTRLGGLIIKDETLSGDDHAPIAVSDADDACGEADAGGETAAGRGKAADNHIPPPEVDQRSFRSPNDINWVHDDFNERQAQMAALSAFNLENRQGELTDEKLMQRPPSIKPMSQTTIASVKKENLEKAARAFKCFDYQSLYGQWLQAIVEAGHYVGVFRQNVLNLSSCEWNDISRKFQAALTQRQKVIHDLMRTKDLLVELGALCGQVLDEKDLEEMKRHILDLDPPRCSQRPRSTKPRHPPFQPGSSSARRGASWPLRVTVSTPAAPQNHPELATSVLVQPRKVQASDMPPLKGKGKAPVHPSKIPSGPGKSKGKAPVHPPKASVPLAVRGKFATVPTEAASVNVNELQQLQNATGGTKAVGTKALLDELITRFTSATRPTKPSSLSYSASRDKPVSSPPDAMLNSEPQATSAGLPPSAVLNNEPQATPASSPPSVMLTSAPAHNVSQVHDSSTGIEDEERNDLYSASMATVSEWAGSESDEADDEDDDDSEDNEGDDADAGRADPQVFCVAPPPSQEVRSWVTSSSFDSGNGQDAAEATNAPSTSLSGEALGPSPNVEPSVSPITTEKAILLETANDDKPSASPVIEKKTTPREMIIPTNKQVTFYLPSSSPSADQPSEAQSYASSSLDDGRDSADSRSADQQTKSWASCSSDNNDDDMDVATTAATSLALSIPKLGMTVEHLEGSITDDDDDEGAVAAVNFAATSLAMSIPKAPTTAQHVVDSDDDHNTATAVYSAAASLAKSLPKSPTIVQHVEKSTADDHDDQNAATAVASAATSFDMSTSKPAKIFHILEESMASLGYRKRDFHRSASGLRNVSMPGDEEHSNGGRTITE